MSRWFSWSQSCDEQLKEFHALKMVLKATFGGIIVMKDTDPVPTSDPQAGKSLLLTHEN